MIQKKYTVLVVEDNEINREIVNLILSEDYNLLFAVNGEEGLSLLRQHVDSINAVLLDLQMPVLDGYGVLEAVDQDESLKGVPIIVTTGDDGVEVEERCLKLHAADFLRKPYNPDIVKLRIHNLIRLREYAAAVNAMEIDQPTGVYTYNAFIHYAQELLKHNPNKDYAMAMSDLIGFKEMIDSFGKKAYEQLREQLRIATDFGDVNIMTGVYSFDHFLFIYPTSLFPESIGKIERERYISQSVANSSRRMKLAVKASVCEHIDRNLPIPTQVELLKTAVDSIHDRYNQFCIMVDSALVEKMNRHKRIAAEMETALKERQMQVWFQPKHDAKSGKLVGAEALLRWIHPELGFISPGEFIPIFEQNGFVSEVDGFVWVETCRLQRKWRDQGLGVVPISVNVSRHDFEDSELADRALKQMADQGCSSDILHLEVTESFFSNLSNEAVSMLDRLREAGVRVELDDFGTGYSSLNSLAELPIDVVKFDMSFVRRLNEPRVQVVMQGCIDMVKRLNFCSVAEGVEDADTCKMLADMGIDTIQGYYYSKPLPAGEFEEYLKRY